MTSEVDRTYYPGDIICSSDDTTVPGVGSYEFQGKIFASVVGKVSQSDKKTEAEKKTMISVVSPISRSFHLPQSGDIVLAKMTYVSIRFAKCIVFALEGQPLPSPFKAQLRREDVRATEKDKINLFKCFRCGDIVAARIIFPVDNAGMLLSTAENELGVVWALSDAEEPLIPLNWCEMQCPLTGAVESRKVAKRLRNDSSEEEKIYEKN